LHTSRQLLLGHVQCGCPLHGGSSFELGRIASHAPKRNGRGRNYRLPQSSTSAGTTSFCDLRGYTSFADAVEPEELLAVLGQFHTAVGRLVKTYDATVGFLAGDGIQVFFNDPIKVFDPALRAVRLACALRQEMAELMPHWRKRGYDLDFGVGIAFGYVTCGEVGFEGRSDYAALGSVTNLAARLSDEAAGGQILVSQRLLAEVEENVEAEPVDEYTLKGFSKPLPASNILGLRERAVARG